MVKRSSDLQIRDFGLRPPPAAKIFQFSEVNPCFFLVVQHQNSEIFSRLRRAKNWFSLIQRGFSMLGARRRRRNFLVFEGIQYRN